MRENARRVDAERVSRMISSDDVRGADRPASGEPRRRIGARDRILGGALKALGRRGLEKVTIEDICETALLSRRTLYRHFQSRQEIIAGVAQHIREQFEAELAEAVQTRPDIAQRVRVVLEQLVYFTRTHEDTSRLIVTEVEFMLTTMAREFEQYVEMIRLTVAPIFAAHAALNQAGLSDRSLAELIVRFAMQLLLMPADAPERAVDGFCLHWDLAMRGALSAPLD